MDLTTPTDHAGAYEWLVVLMAHGGVGFALVALVAAYLNAFARDWIDDTGNIAWSLVVLFYLMGWEGAVQHYGAGLADAALDTFGVAAGGLIGLLAWRRRGVLLGLTLALFAVVAGIGIRGRK